MPEAVKHGGSLITLLRWVKVNFINDDEIQTTITRIVEAIIKTFKNEGEHIPQELYDSVCESNKLVVQSEQMVKERGLQM